jgi:hypothetical protein
VDQPVERVFTVLTQRENRQGTRHSGQELEAALRHYIDEHNQCAKPFILANTGDQIPQRVARFGQRLSGTGH